MGGKLSSKMMEDEENNSSETTLPSDFSAKGVLQYRKEAAVSCIEGQRRENFDPKFVGVVKRTTFVDDEDHLELDNDQIGVDSTGIDVKAALPEKNETFASIVNQSLRSCRGLRAVKGKMMDETEYCPGRQNLFKKPKETTGRLKVPKKNFKKVNSKYSMRPRKSTKQQYVNFIIYCNWHKDPVLYSFPTGGRNRLPWSSSEEEILKEGVYKFCNGKDKRNPWKQILSYGNEVFEKSRTTVDLKDKWRNLCRSKSKRR